MRLTLTSGQRIGRETSRKKRRDDKRLGGNWAGNVCFQLLQVPAKTLFMSRTQFSAVKIRFCRSETFFRMTFFASSGFAFRAQFLALARERILHRLRFPAPQNFSVSKKTTTVVMDDFNIGSPPVQH